jgi:PAS domain S-box-containing protein
MKKGGISESGKLLNNTKEYPGERNGLYRSLFENSTHAILLTGPDGSIFSSNPAASKMFGWSVEEIYRLGRKGLVDTSDPRLNTGLLLHERDGSVFGELTMISKNGERFPVEISSNIFPDPSGNGRTRMIIRDISERKKFEKEMQQVSISTRNLIEASIDSLLTINIKGIITNGNWLVNKNNSIYTRIAN